MVSIGRMHGSIRFAGGRRIARGIILLRFENVLTAVENASRNVDPSALCGNLRLEGKALISVAFPFQTNRGAGHFLGCCSRNKVNILKSIPSNNAEGPFPSGRRVTSLLHMRLKSRKRLGSVSRPLRHL